MSKVVLSNKKKKWLKQFKPKNIVIEGTAARPSITTLNQFQKIFMQELRAGLDDELQNYKKYLKNNNISDVLKKVNVQTTTETGISLDSQGYNALDFIKYQKSRDRVKAVRKRYGIIEKRILALLKGLSKQSKLKVDASLSKLAGKNQKTLKINDFTEDALFRANISEYAAYIVTAREGALKGFSDKVYSSISNGGSWGDLQKELQENLKDQYKRIRNRAKNTALDQTRKAFAGLNRARYRSAGVNNWKWQHSGGSQTPRCYHSDPYPQGLNGGVYSYDDPPVINKKTGRRGFPGDEPNCGCQEVPVISIGENDGR